MAITVSAAYMCYSYVRLHFTNKAGVGFLVSPTRGADCGSDVCAREQTIASQATPFAVRVWLARLGTAGR